MVHIPRAVVVHVEVQGERDVEVVVDVVPDPEAPDRTESPRTITARASPGSSKPALVSSDVTSTMAEAPVSTGAAPLTPDGTACKSPGADRSGSAGSTS